MLISLLVLFFFFSSRRRHTRCLSDWSSDVCSSDLPPVADAGADRTIAYQDQFNDARGFFIGGPGGSDPDSHALRFERSEERRVGKSVDLGGGRLIQKNTKIEAINEDGEHSIRV